MNIAGSFRDLRVYQLARKAAREVFELSKSFPREERYALTDQIRRSARATKAMMLARMIDRAADFCKYESDTDYRGRVAEDPENWTLDHDDRDLAQ